MKLPPSWPWRPGRSPLRRNMATMGTVIAAPARITGGTCYELPRRSLSGPTMKPGVSVSDTTPAGLQFWRSAGRRAVLPRHRIHRAAKWLAIVGDHGERPPSSA